MLALLATAACDRGADPAAGDGAGSTSSTASTGAAWTDPRPLFEAKHTKAACPHQRRPALALRGDGALVAIWFESPDSSRVRLLWSERPAGAGWSEPRPVAGDAYGYWDDGPAKLVSMPDGSLALAWRSGAEDPEAPRALRVALLGAKGGSWQPASSPPNVDATPLGVHLTAGSDGLHMIWQDEQTIRHSRRSADGSWSKAESLRPPGRTAIVETSAGRVRTATSGFAPISAPGPDGELMVGWWDDERSLGRSDQNMFDLVLRFYDPKKRMWSAPEIVPGTSSMEAEAAASAGPDGFILVSVDAAGRLQARMHPFRGGGWSAAAAVPVDDGRRAVSPALVRSSDGRLLLTWRSFAEGGDNRLRAAMSAKGAGFQHAFSSPELGGEDPMHGGLFNDRGTPLVWFNDPVVRAGCSGIVWSEMIGDRNVDEQQRRTKS